ncbi:hypothetical protein BDC45DRAFT_515474 [Circinella umbellata]|nr:hypothetical protein BDC45DRAFT_515474 [Circinella umbellata]
MATTSKRLFTYLLSIIGLDRIAHSTIINDTLSTTTTTTPPSSSTLSNDSYNSSKTNVSFMSESTLFVNADIAGLFDEKCVQDPGIHMIPYDTWSLQTWINGLSRMALCQMITTTAVRCPRIILQMIEEYQPSTHSHQKQEQEQTKKLKSFYNHLIDDNKNQENNSFCHYQEILTIQKRAQFIIHSLDHLRPSEQFANEPELAQEIQSLVRWCTNILHTSTRPSSSSSSSSSLVALVGLLVIAREGLSAIPEIRKYLFGKAYLGRMVILEMSSVLKNFKESPLLHSHSNSHNGTDYNLLLLPYQWSLLLRILDPPQQIIQASYHYQVTWLIQLLSDICHQMASCDKEWFYFQEYNNVITMATRNYCT